MTEKNIWKQQEILPQNANNHSNEINDDQCLNIVLEVYLVWMLYLKMRRKEIENYHSIRTD